MVSRELPPDRAPLGADVLARLLVVQQALDVLPGEEEVASFLSRALEQVPGVGDAVLILEGRRPAPETDLGTAAAKAGTGGGVLPGDALPGLPGSAAFPVRTLRRAYGLLALELSDREAFAPYVPVVANVAGSVATTLETRELLRMTTAARSQLEELVATRTSELAERTGRLEEEMTEKDRVLAALAESEERLRLVAANAQDAIIVIDEAGRVTMWNPAAERIFGRSRAEMIGQEIHEAIAPPRSLEAFRRGFAAFSRFGIGPFVGRSIEVTALRPNGVEFPVEISVSPVKVRGHWHAIGIIRDITERKRGDAVRDALAAIVRSTTDAVVGKTTEGIVTSWNAGAERLYGYSAREMIGRPLADLAPPGKADEVLRLTELARTGQIVEDYETLRVHRDGRLLDVSLTLAPIRDDAGLVVGVSTIARDITRRKETERALRESEARLEEAQRIAHLGSWEWSIADGSLGTSAEALRIYGVEDRSSVRTFASSLERIHPADRPAVVAAVHGLLEGKSPSPIDYRIVKPGGAVRHVLGTAKVVRDSAGRPEPDDRNRPGRDRAPARGAGPPAHEPVLADAFVVQPDARPRDLRDGAPGGDVHHPRRGGRVPACLGRPAGGGDPRARARGLPRPGRGRKGVGLGRRPESGLCGAGGRLDRPGLPRAPGPSRNAPRTGRSGGRCRGSPARRRGHCRGAARPGGEGPRRARSPRRRPRHVRRGGDPPRLGARGRSRLRDRGAAGQVRQEGRSPRKAEVPRPDSPEPRGDRRDDRGHGRGARPVHRRSPAARGRLRRRDRKRSWGSTKRPCRVSTSPGPSTTWGRSRSPRRSSPDLASSPRSRSGSSRSTRRPAGRS
ncbi:MAG: PAS domain S-box protein [Holophagales bacterium]|nr:PAS domain S-box protein [Holophagales bacterium]